MNVLYWDINSIPNNDTQLLSTCICIKKMLNNRKLKYKNEWDGYSYEVYIT